MASQTVSEALPSLSYNTNGRTCEEPDEYIDEDNYGIVNYNMLFNYVKIMKELEPFALRCYEAPYQLYFVVAQPYKDKYEQNKSWYRYKGMDYVRKFCKPKDYVLSTEIKASQVHVNALVWTEKDLSKFHKKGCGKRYGFYVTKMNLKTQQDRFNVLSYMMKEARKRYFHLFRDYVYKIKL